MHTEDLNEIILQKISFGDLTDEEVVQSFTLLAQYFNLMTIQDGVKYSGLHYRTVERLSRVQIGKVKFVSLQDLTEYKNNRNKSS